MSYFLRSYVWLLFPLGFVGAVAAGLKGVLAAILLSLVLTPIIMFLSDKIASCAGGFYGGRRPLWSVKERFSGDLDRSKNYKMQGEFNPALEIVNAILDQAPDYPEAMFLKAQILWEGFGERSSAKAYLKRIMKIIPNENDPIRRWAASLYADLNQKSLHGENTVHAPRNNPLKPPK
jgi:tetratricopeptide (TPR) repeat protein